MLPAIHYLRVADVRLLQPHGPSSKGKEGRFLGAWLATFPQLFPFPHIMVKDIKGVLSIKHHLSFYTCLEKAGELFLF